MLLVVILSSLLAISTGTIHIVTPEDDLFGINKFFTSNTQLFFLPGNMIFTMKLLYKMFTIFHSLAMILH